MNGGDIERFMPWVHRMPADCRKLNLPLFVRGLLVGLGTLAGVEFGYLLSFADLPIVTIWPPLGILIAALTLSPGRHWPAYLGASLVACCLSHVWLHERTWVQSLGLCAGDQVAALSAAGLILWRRGDAFGFQTLQQVLDFLVRAAPGIALGAVVAGALFVTVDPQQDFLQIALSWWLARALGVVLIGSLVIAWLVDQQPAPQASQVLRALGGIVLGIGIVWGLSVMKGSARVALAYPLLFVPLPAYAAIVYSRRTALAMVLIVGGLGIYRTAQGASVIAQVCESSLESAVCIQLVVAMISLSGLTVATIVDERRAAQRENRETLRLLWEANQELERRVAERTQRLEQTSADLLEKRNLLAHASRVSTAGELAAGIAHELNQPLYAINNYASGLAHCLENGASEANVREVLGDLRQESQRAAGILKRLRQFVQVTPYKSECLCFGDVVNDALQLNRHEFRQTGIDVEVNLPTELPAVQGDAIQLQQVLVNLIRNAVESLLLVSPGQRRLTIHVIACDGWLRTRVQDTGAGFLPEDEGRLFDPFYTTKPQGMGIGLTLSRSIVEAHGGQFTASRVEPRGAAFEFALPLPPAPPRAARSKATVPEPHFALAPSLRTHEPTDLPGR